MITFVSVAISDEVDTDTCPKPVGTAEFDFMLAHVWAKDETITSAPAGWEFSPVQFPLETSDGAEQFNSYFYFKRVGASEPSSYTWETTGADPNRRIVIVSYRGVIRGVDADDAFTGLTTNHTEDSGANILTMNMDGTWAQGLRMVILAAVGIPGTTATLGSPYVERLDEDGNFVYDRRLVAETVVIDPVVTFSSVITSFGRGLFLIPEPDGPGDRNYCGSVDTQIN